MVEQGIAILVGAATGVLSGMGIGGGTLLVLYLTTATDMDNIAAAGINLLYFLGCAPTSLWFHARQKRLDTRAALWAIVGGGPAALVTSLLTPDESPLWLEKAFGALLLAVGIRECITFFQTVKNKG